MTFTTIDINKKAKTNDHKNYFKIFVLSIAAAATLAVNIYVFSSAEEITPYVKGLDDHKTEIVSLIE